ncbi:FliM/FliN family flagellar motor C-terminal domain-containing protein [Roseovarius nanhaiticus]|uniref:FliM/FliN family flagellar motor C-terminal domain-containing protein n=1 Tax=Roseovarius nanhaiticus TaxID=573024 RepID=UPI0024931073|nr:FliM/FliN family flagellar motor C-terminal domain-containing protein [Roseovarius nanhaiticus]
MTSQGGNTVIHRKARASREEYQARAMSPAKALRLALAQASGALFDLPMIVAAVEQVEISQTALRAEFADGGLMVLLDGPRGARGAVRLDAALLAALIEIQTTGRITGRDTGGRAVTRTDAAIAAPLIDAALAGAEAKLTEDADPQEDGKAAAPHWATGYRFGVMMDDARGMALALDAPAFHVFRMMVELGDDGYPGALTFLIPVPEVPARPAADAGDDGLRRTLEQSAMNAPALLDAVLGRVTLPLEKVCNFEVGALIPLSGEPGLKVRLEASQKHVVALARLGQMNGARAVRLLPGKDAVAAPSDTGANGGARASNQSFDMAMISDIADAAAGLAPVPAPSVGLPPNVAAPVRIESAARDPARMEDQAVE